MRGRTCARCPHPRKERCTCASSSLACAHMRRPACHPTHANRRLASQPGVRHSPSAPVTEASCSWRSQAWRPPSTSARLSSPNTTSWRRPPAYSAAAGTRAPPTRCGASPATNAAGCTAVPSAADTTCTSRPAALAVASATAGLPPAGKQPEAAAPGACLTSVAPLLLRPSSAAPSLSCSMACEAQRPASSCAPSVLAPDGSREDRRVQARRLAPASSSAAHTLLPLADSAATAPSDSTSCAALSDSLALRLRRRTSLPSAPSCAAVRDDLRVGGQAGDGWLGACMQHAAWPATACRQAWSHSHPALQHVACHRSPLHSGRPCAAVGTRIQLGRSARQLRGPQQVAISQRKGLPAGAAGWHSVSKAGEAAGAAGVHRALDRNDAATAITGGLPTGCHHLQASAP